MRLHVLCKCSFAVLTSVAALGVQSHGHSNPKSLGRSSLFTRDIDTVVAAHDITPAKTPKHHCEDIHEAKDRCKHARKYCSPESAGMADYITWYYCDMQDAQPVAFTILVLWTGLLFSTIGIASSDFFCPNLATIANSLGMSQSVAGVTFLAFGNGSPDVFSTFAAFKAHSGSLAIGELLGAAAFITSVVAGAMAIISPFKVSRRSFLRDAGFFLLAVLMTMFLLADGRLRLWESILMIIFYASYVAYVLIGTWLTTRGRKEKIMKARVRSQYGPSEGGSPENFDREDMDADTSRLLAENDRTIANIETGEDDDDDDARSTEHDFHDLNSSMSVTGRPIHTSVNTVRPSLLGALEFRELVTSMAEDGTISSGALRSMKRRSRANSTATHGTFDGRPNTVRTRSATLAKSSALISPEVDFTHQHNHIHAHGHKGKVAGSQSPALSVIPSRPCSISRQNTSRSNLGSPLETPVEDIASASLRRQNPIELLDSDGQRSQPAIRTADIPSIHIDMPYEESDPFVKAWGSSETPDVDLPAVPSYHATEETTPLQRDEDESQVSEQAEEVNEEARSAPNWWPLSILPHPILMRNLLFPTLMDFAEQTLTQKFLSVLAVPSVLVLTITLPVVNPPINQRAAELNESGQDLEAVIAKDDAERYTAHRGWNRWLTSIQCLLAPLLVSVTIFSDQENALLPILIALGLGLVFLGLTLILTSQERRPRFHSWFCFVGFAVSVVWISTIANEVVGTLQAFGTILGISDAILGLTVFAVGNSLGDFVADVTVARMGFSQMAISGVFGGPMLNILLGIGISGIYINISKHHVYNAEISPTLIVSAASLLTTLIVLLIAVPANDYVMSRKLGIALCCIFVTGMIVSVLVELFLTS